MFLKCEDKENEKENMKESRKIFSTCLFLLLLVTPYLDYLLIDVLVT